MSKNNTDWFAVDTAGLRQLQMTKPKHYVLRELVQNAWDENTANCIVNTSYDKSSGIAEIMVLDDSPEGFKDLRDAFTLFKHTSKRANPNQRGRFNLGEKQAIAISEYAMISTTKGTVRFDNKGRKESAEKMKKGSTVALQVKMTEKEYGDMLEMAQRYIAPSNINYTLNSQLVERAYPTEVFTVNLPTEIEVEGQIRSTNRNTEVNVYTDVNDPRRLGWLYEMGLPVCEIDCEFGISVEQKIPLNVDRELVKPAYLQDLFAEVLNHTTEKITEENASASWVRSAMSDERTTQEAAQVVIKQRYGDKILVANHLDPNSIDIALSNGYRVIEGREMSKAEWAVTKAFDIIHSTSELFGTSFTDADTVKPTEAMNKVGNYAKKIAKNMLDISIKTNFIKSKMSNVSATFNYETLILTFVVDKLPSDFFDHPISRQTTSLIIHELGHYGGNHVESGYHDLITKLGSELTFKALENPEFFGGE